MMKLIYNMLMITFKIILAKAIEMTVINRLNNKKGEIRICLITFGYF